MKRQVIVPVVEGHGEERAVPVLVRRWLEHRNFHRRFEVQDPAVNAKGCGTLKAAYDRKRHVGIEHYIQAALNARPAAILVVLDADKECLTRPKGNGLGPELLQRAQAVAGPVPVSVVVANRTYEAWLLAGRAALYRCDLVARDAPLRKLSSPESRAGSKGTLSEFLIEPYSPPVHQPRLTESISFSSGSQRRAPSFGKLLRELEAMTRQVGAPS